MATKYTVSKKILLCFFFICGLGFMACEKKTAPDPEKTGQQEGGTGKETGSNDATEELFTSFNTPEWSEKIDCSRLNFVPQSCSDSVLYVNATSQSTKAQLYIAYPLDSVTLSRVTLNKKFPIYVNYCSNQTALQKAITFFMAVPQKSGSSTYWIPTEDDLANSYTLIKKIKYLSSDAHYARFLVAGSYSQQSVLASTSSGPLNTKGTVTGDFQLIIWADRINIADQPNHQPASIKPESNVMLKGYANQPLAQKLTARVQNDFHMYLPDIPVKWVVTKGGGKVTHSETLTDQHGRTSVEWTLGDGEEQELEARVSRFDGQPVAPVVYKANAASNRIVMVSGNKQFGQTGFSTRGPQVIKVLDRHNQIAKNVKVVWKVIKGGGKVDYNLDSMYYYSNEDDGTIALMQQWIMGAPGEQQLQASLRNFAGEVINEYTFTATSHDSLSVIKKQIPGDWSVQWKNNQNQIIQDYGFKLLANQKVQRTYAHYSNGTNVDFGEDAIIRSPWQLVYKPEDGHYHVLFNLNYEETLGFDFNCIVTYPPLKPFTPADNKIYSKN